MSSAGPGAGRSSEAGNVSSRGVGSSSFGSVGDNATFKWELKRPLTHVAWLPVSVCLVIAATIGFVVFAVAQWPGGPQIQYVWFYVLVALALLIAGAAALYPADRTGQTCDAVQQAADTRRRRTARAILVGAAALCCGGGALAWVDVDRTGEVGVEMAIRGTQPVGDTGGTLTVEMTRPASGDVRDKLRLVLTIIDDDPSTPTCVGRTTATITAVTPGITPNAREVPAQSTVDFDLGGREGAVRFAVDVWPETGCSMRLAQARGTLHNN
ncbi:hypothetical protein JL475_38080 [Streptomyces sp. M2CJ-2]|uniref:hypothetical protein n=1 Tax=Streptomyces sp. M2CJ-2 TaxID=2803948 RepID=UPI001926A5D4|nr:hypothetical protein [Streptomyces sp. M2CJ-2]MBL3671581.1 hypothetical protein [Streptomyces sp. M2CJ-2]